jgi:hypothetical protein
VVGDGTGARPWDAVAAAPCRRDRDTPRGAGPAVVNPEHHPAVNNQARANPEAAAGSSRPAASS